MSGVLLERRGVLSQANKVFANDQFTDSAGTALQSHTPNKGGPWVRHPQSSANNAVITQLGARMRSGSSSNTLLYYITANPAAAEYDVISDVIQTGTPTGEASGVCARLDVTVATMYLARYTFASTQWQLAKVVAGSLTSLGLSTSMPLTVGAIYQVKLQIRDAAKKLFVKQPSDPDFVELVTSADNTITAAGKAGWRGFITTADDANSLYFDNFTASNL